MSNSKLSKGEMLQEYVKCAYDPCYYAENYCQVYDQTANQGGGGYVKYDLFETQKRLIKSFQDHRFNIALKYRQAGISTTTALFVATHVMFATNDNPKKVLIVANRLDMAVEFYKKVVHFVGQAPAWMGINYDKFTQSHFILSNQSEVKAVATSDDVMRGYTPTFLILEEASVIPNGREVFESAMPTLNTGGRCALIGTPKGQDRLYYFVYDKAIKKENNFNVVELRWFEDPRYVRNKLTGEYDLVWRYGDKEIIEKDPAKQWKLYRNGWRPFSSWYMEASRMMNGDEKIINQELNCEFIGSGGSFINERFILEQKNANVLDKFEIEKHEGNARIWEEPKISGHILKYGPNKGEVYQGCNCGSCTGEHKYVLGADVASGSGADYSTIQIFDVVSGNQVMEYKGKVPPDVLAEYIYDYGMRYNAIAAVDNAGGWGHSTLIKLHEMSYPKIYYSEPKSKLIEGQLKKYTRGSGESLKTPGINSSSYRSLILAELEKKIRNGEIRIRSVRLISELYDFVENNSGKVEAKRGSNDDLVIAAAISLYVMEVGLKNFETSKNHTKAMLNAWAIDTDTNTNPTNSSWGNSFTSNNYDGDYGWLLM